MGTPWYRGNSEEATEESEEMTNDLGGFDHPWPQSLIGSWSTTPSDSPSWWDFDHLFPQSLIGSWSTTPSRSPSLWDFDHLLPQSLTGLWLTTPSESPCMWGFDNPSPQSLIGAWSTTHPQSPSLWDFNRPLPHSFVGSCSTTHPQSPCLWDFDHQSFQSLIGSGSTTAPQSPCLCGFDHLSSQSLIGSCSATAPQLPCLWGSDHPSPQYLIGSRSTTSPQSPCLWGFDPPSSQYPIGSCSTTPHQTPCLWGFNPPSPQYLNGSQLTTPSQSPPVFLPCFGFRPRSDALSFANRERSMLLQQELLDEWSDVFNCAAAGGISQQQQQLHQLQYWIQVLNFVLKAATIMVNWWEQGSRGPRGEWVAKTRVGPKWLKKPKKSKRPCICGTYETAEVATMHGEEKYRMRGEKTRLNFPKLFLKITDPCLLAGESDSTHKLLQEWSNNAFDFNAKGIFELLQYWSYALNFAVKGLAMTLNGLQPIRKRQGHGGEWVVKIRIRRSRHGNGDLDIIKLKEEKTRLNFPKLFLSTCGKGKAITKTPGVKIEIPLKHILQCKEMRLRDAAKSLKVSPSTLIRVCREYGIHSWPRRENNPINKSCPSKSPVVVDRERILQLNSDIMFSSKQDSATVDMNIVTVKARFGKGITIKFQLSLPWKMVELEQQVKRRLKLEPGTYHIKYKDDENELILIACDDDLKDCISRYGLMGTSSILVFLEPK